MYKIFTFKLDSTAYKLRKKFVGTMFTQKQRFNIFRQTVPLRKSTGNARRASVPDMGACRNAETGAATKVASKKCQQISCSYRNVGVSILFAAKEE